MSARIVIVELLPSGKPGFVQTIVTSEVSDGSSLTVAEITFTLEQILEGLRAGSIVPRTGSGELILGVEGEKP